MKKIIPYDVFSELLDFNTGKFIDYSQSFEITSDYEYDNFVDTLNSIQFLEKNKDSINNITNLNKYIDGYNYEISNTISDILEILFYNYDLDSILEFNKMSKIDNLNPTFKLYLKYFDFGFTIQTNATKERVYHNYFIGTKMNDMMKYIPNFIYTYGKIEYNNIPYVIYNDLSNCDNLTKYSTYCTNSDIFDIYMQILYLLKTLDSKNIVFCHNNLNCSNIFIKTRKEKIKIDYSDINRSINTNNISIITDFSKSIYKMDYTIGNNIRYKYFGEQNKPYIFHDYLFGDAYFLFYTIAYANETNKNQKIDNFIDIVSHFFYGKGFKEFTTDLETYYNENKNRITLDEYKYYKFKISMQPKIRLDDLILYLESQKDNIIGFENDLFSANETSYKYYEPNYNTFINEINYKPIKIQREIREFVITPSINVDASFNGFINYDNYNDYDTSRIIKEKEYFNEHIYSSLNITNMNMSEIKKYIDKEFYNSIISEELMGILNKILFNRQNIVKYFTNLYKLSEGSYGVVFKSDFLNQSDIFIIKSPKGERKVILHENDIDIYDIEIETIHEFFIGKHLNTLRREIPNFMYTYGGFRCSPPILAQNDVVSWCDNDIINPYLVLEYVRPSVTIDNYCKKCTSEDFLNKYIQILFALEIADSKYSFTHYDMHGKNVLIRYTEEKNFYLYYQINNKQYYIETDGIATILDYGKAHVYIEDEKMHYGLNEEQFNIYNKSYTFADAFELFMSCALSAYISGNTKMYNAVDYISYFFFGGTMFKFNKEMHLYKDFLYKQLKVAKYKSELKDVISNYRHLFYKVGFQYKLTTKDLITYILNSSYNFNIYSKIQDEKIKIFNCYDDKCTTIEEFRKNANIKKLF